MKLILVILGVVIGYLAVCCAVLIEGAENNKEIVFIDTSKGEGV